MRIDQTVNIEDLHRMAKRRLPKIQIAFDFIEGDLEDERGLERNTLALVSTAWCRATWSTFPSGTIGVLVRPRLCEAVRLDFLWRDEWQRNL